MYEEFWICYWSRDNFYGCKEISKVRFFFFGSNSKGKIGTCLFTLFGFIVSLPTPFCNHVNCWTISFIVYFKFVWKFTTYIDSKYYDHKDWTTISRTRQCLWPITIGPPYFKTRISWLFLVVIRIHLGFNLTLRFNNPVPFSEIFLVLYDLTSLKGQLVKPSSTIATF